MAAFFQERGQTLRFIEYMDVGHTNGWRLDDVVPAARDRRARSTRAFGVEPVDPAYRGEVAQRWRYRDGSGEVGVIASVTQPFCGDCTRARLSAEGQGLHLPVRRARHRPARARSAAARSTTSSPPPFAAIWGGRADRYSELRSAATNDLPKVEMSYIGG